jgi:hypothetical protein
MLYHALWQGGYPATLSELRERLRNKPYKKDVTGPYLAALASRLEGKGYVKSERVPSGRVGQPPTSLMPIVPLAVVIRAETENAIEQLAWNDPDALEIICQVVGEAVAKAPKPPKPRRIALPAKRPVKAKARIDRRGESV